MWFVGASLASGSKKLSAECGLSGRKGRVGQRNCRWYVVCRGEKGEWVKRIVASVWSVVAKTLRGSRELSLACGLSGRKGRVGQGACQRSVVCRGENAAWVKRIVGGVWFVGAKRASGSRGLSLVCGLSGRKGRVGQKACQRSVVCRGENAAWVKRIVGGVWSGGEKGEWVKRIVASVWSVGAKRASGSRGLSVECGLSGRKRCVGQENCRWSVVCRGEKGEWVKRNHTYRMPQTSQIATQIKIAKTLKT